MFCFFFLNPSERGLFLSACPLQALQRSQIHSGSVQKTIFPLFYSLMEKLRQQAEFPQFWGAQVTSGLVSREALV